MGMVYNLFDWLTSGPIVANILQFLMLVATGIGAGATVFIAWLARDNLKALHDQLEASHTPFVLLIAIRGDTENMIRYRFENQGVGPAVNIMSVLEWEGGGRQHFLPKTLGRGGRYEFEDYHRCLKAEFSYESLSGRKYATKINFRGGIQFLRLS